MKWLCNNLYFLLVSLYAVILYTVYCKKLPYILKYNTHPGFGDLLNGKKLIRVSNAHISFHRPMPTLQTDWIILDVTNALKSDDTSRADKS
jgi:hypothetical protein